MAKIDSVYDLSDKALVEIKSWLEPWFLTRDRQGTIAGAGVSVVTTDGIIVVDPTEFLTIGSGITLTSPVPGTANIEASGGGGGGIDFNKLNNTDAAGADADYLWLRYIGSSPLPGGTYGSSTNYGDLVYLNQDEGTGGQMIVNNGGGVIGLDNTGDGILGTVMGGSTAKFDGPPVGGVGPNVSVFLRSSGDGSVWLKSESAPLILDSRSDVIFITSVGNDINEVGVKISTGFNDFLVQGDQSITRNGSGVITAITPSAEAFRVSPGNAPGGKNAVYFKNLPTSATSLTTGQIWNSSGTLHIV